MGWKRKTAVAAMVGAVSVAGAYSSVGASTPPTTQVVAAAFRFTTGEDYVTVQRQAKVAWPRELSVKRGTNIELVNLDPVPHTFTADGCPDGKGFIDPEPPQPAATVADAFDDRIGPAVFGQPSFPEHGRCPFDSRGRNPNGFTPATGGMTLVNTSRLRAGTYRFHCVLHDFMQGTLRVT